MKDTIKILTRPYYIKCKKEIELAGHDKFGEVIEVNIKNDVSLVAFQSIHPTKLKVITLIDTDYNIFFLKSSPSHQTLSCFTIEKPLTYTRKEIIGFIQNKKYELI